MVLFIATIVVLFVVLFCLVFAFVLRRHPNKKLSVVSDVFMCLALLFVFGSFYYLFSSEKASKDLVDEKSNVLVTAAHLDTVPGYKLMYKDAKRDVAYYLASDAVLTTLPSQPVQIKGLKNCKIVSSTKGSFVVSTSSVSNITDGLSGERVLSQSGVPIGFVVAIKGAGELDCRTLE